MGEPASSVPQTTPGGAAPGAGSRPDTAGKTPGAAGGLDSSTELGAAMNRLRRLHAALGVLAIATAATAAAGAETARELRYNVVMMGNPAGTQVTRITPATTGEVREIAFEFNDRGRGPKLQQRIEIGARGLISMLEISGNDYMK